MTNSIYYFSGTGNCLAVAKQIANEITNINIFPITRERLASINKIDDNMCIIIYPAYAYGMPSMLYQFFKKVEIKADYVVLVVTYGTKYGAALAHGYRWIKHSERLYCAGIKSVENYIPIFGLSKKEVIDKNIKSQRENTQKLIEEIKKQQTNKVRTFHPGYFVISALFRIFKRTFVKGYKVNDQCNGCGLCEKICPGKAISMKDNKPHFDAKKCEHCQGCLNWCFQKAIKYLKINKEYGRYHHPDITIKDIQKR